MPTRKSSIDPEAAHKLEKSLAQRPDKHELIDRNILKGTRVRPLSSGPSLNDVGNLDDTVAPSLQAAKEKLQRSQLEVSIDNLVEPLGI